VFILDTDAMTVWLDPRHALRDNVARRFVGLGALQRVTTVVSLQEQVRGWLSEIHRARKASEIIGAYANLHTAFKGYCEFEVLAYDRAAQNRFEDFRRQKIRVPTMDLRIACIALVSNATLLTRNVRDFRQVPGLTFEDCSR
jgi:tRNA(fMet)-specific endonuclease VapC